MTETRLNEIEALLRNPPSNGMLAELGLELLAELRSLRAPGAIVVDMSKLEMTANLHPGTSFGIREALETTVIPAPMPELLSHERPTPPMGIVIEPHEKKKGKR